MEALDQGLVFEYGHGPEKSDFLGAREVWVFEADGLYHMTYDGAGPDGWLACLATSRDLVTWVCEKRNAYLAEKEAPEDLQEDCQNYGGLVRKYGPNYDGLKAKLGHVRGLFD